MDFGLIGVIIGVVGIIVGAAFGVGCLWYAKYCQDQNQRRDESNMNENRAQFTDVKGTLTENNVQLQAIEVSLTQFRDREKATNYPEIKKENNVGNAFAAFFIIVLIFVLAAALGSYLSKKR